MIREGSVLLVDAVFVHLPGFCRSCVTFPEVAVVDAVHGPLLPAGKFTDEGNFRGAWSKGAEYDPSPRFGMCAEKSVSVKYFSCVKSVKIHIASPPVK